MPKDNNLSESPEYSDVNYKRIPHQILWNKYLIDNKIIPVLDLDELREEKKIKNREGV